MAHSFDPFPVYAGVCLDVLLGLNDVPILGVCLGHQALAHVHGARVVKAPEPVHGRLSELRHCGHHRLFEGIPSGPGEGFEVVRYHSLVVDATSLPECLEPIAWTCGGHHAVQLDKDQKGLGGFQASLSAESSVDSRSSIEGSRREPGFETGAGGIIAQPLIMAIAHRSRPHFGVQFHPESILTQFGSRLISNFYNLTRAARGGSTVPRREGCIFTHAHDDIWERES